VCESKDDELRTRLIAFTISTDDTPSQQIDLQAMAKQAMMDNGFESEFSPKFSNSSQS